MNLWKKEMFTTTKCFYNKRGKFMYYLKLFVIDSKLCCCGKPMKPVSLESCNGWRCEICGSTVVDLVTCDKDIFTNDQAQQQSCNVTPNTTKGDSIS